ncbi:MAG: hypothetical protein ABJQ70_10290 [Roseobacter sp.]
MKRRNLLYYTTGGWFVLTVLAGVYSLFRSTMPYSEATSSTVYAVNVANFEPGHSQTFKLGDVPVLVWRRDLTQKIEALKLLDVNFTENPNLLEEIRDIGEIEIEPGSVFRFEWFAVSPINIGGHGCIVQPDAGDYGGFYDSCQGVHFDLWGRVHAGPTQRDLQVIPWRWSDDGSVMWVDTKNAPEF